ncbi:MAG: transcriptional regulator, RpiR family [Variovorax sp.]|nr:transcriptional regulator, RpiR family [Variovorax sp.]
MTPEPNRSFLGLVRQLLNSLPPTERKLGEFVLDFPGDLATYTASELATLVGVSNATVTRFIQRLGYSNYEDARRQAREERSNGSPLFLSAQGSRGLEGSITSHILQAQDNIVATFNHIPAELIDDVAQALAAAGNVWFLGYRNNRNFASYLRWQLVQLRENVHVLPGPGETLGEYVAGLGSKDVLVVFALRRSVPIATRFALLAARAGTQVLYITDHFSKVSLSARWLLRCHTQAPGPLDNHASVMLLCHLLATRVLHHVGTKGRRRMASIETQHDALNEMRDDAEPARP